MTVAPTQDQAKVARRARLVRRIRFLVVFTIAYNLIEGGVALAAGAIADSSALVGFGLDSLVEVSSALGVAWQFAARDHQVREAREQIALRITSCSFFALAIFIAYHSISSLTGGQAAQYSGVGITIAALSLLIMPLVSGLQRDAGRQLGSTSAVADSKQTLLCTYMSAVLLLGLLANSLLGWWWADPTAALAITTLAIREGINAGRGDACCPPAEALFEHDHIRETGAAGTAPEADHCCDNEPKRILERPAAVEPSPTPHLPPRAATTPRAEHHPGLTTKSVQHCACGEECSP